MTEDWLKTTAKNKLEELRKQQKEVQKKIQLEYKKKDEINKAITLEEWKAIINEVKEHYNSESKKIPSYRRWYFHDNIANLVIMPLLAPPKKSGTKQDGTTWDNGPRPKSNGGYSWKMYTPVRDDSIIVFSDKKERYPDFEQVLWGRGYLSEKFRLLGDDAAGKYGLFNTEFQKHYKKWPNEYDPSELEYFYTFELWQVLEKVNV